jgi:response regulator of citrate/malate metabolism
MTTKERSVLDFWFRALWACNQRDNNHVSAQRVGESVGMARNTAKKYLARMIEKGAVEKISVIGKNKQEAFLYAVKGGWQ